MNVGSILNGDSPQDEPANTSTTSDIDRDDAGSRGLRPSLPDSSHRQSINILLNDAPSQAGNTGALGDSSGSAGNPGSPGKTGTGEGKAAGNNSDQVDDKIDDEDDDDVDAEAARIDRELAAASLEDAEREKQKKTLKTVKTEEAAENPPVSATKNAAGLKHQLNQTEAVSNRKQFLSGELEKLNKLKAEKKKPHRYLEPPIWAQEWMPPSQKGGSYTQSVESSVGTGSFSGLNGDVSGLSLKPVFNRESMTLADLECLITGVIPPQSAVRTIAEWLYANFVEILLENRQYVELELKFGTIVSKETGSRIDIGVSTECIYTNTSNTRFEMGVHEAGWGEMKTFLDELEKTYVEVGRKDPTKPRRKFSLTESNNTDYFYQITERNEKPKKIRISKDNLLSPARYVAISKQRVSDLYIHNPSCMYDLRLSLSIEFPVDEDSIEPIMKKNKPSLQRGKKRASYSHAPTVTRFDFTEVSIPRSTKNKAGRSVVENDKSHELELEIDTFQIFRGFDRVRDGLDSIRFEELVEVFLNNARCLNNRVTKFASK